MADINFSTLLSGLSATNTPGATTPKPGWSDLAITGLAAYNEQTKPAGGVTASTVLNNNYDLKLPEVQPSTMATDWTANVNLGANSIDPNKKKDNTLLFVGIGVAVVIVVIVVFFVIKKK